jgi:class 3 adenylate cyclase
MMAWLLGAALAAALLALYRKAARERALRAQLEGAAAELQRLQQSCARFAPANVIDRVVTDGRDAAAERKEITALFADIVGYTALSEQLEPKVLARLLNGYYQRMSDAISAHRGHVSTFLGDGILAYFGAFEPNPWQGDDALRAALAMRAALADYSRELEQEGLPRLAIGIGLHRGMVLAGLVGSRERSEYACVGRTVNVAARVQALTREHGVDVLLTEEVRARLDPSFRLRALPAMQVKGIDVPVVTYTVT